MKEYESLDLSGSYNAGAEVLDGLELPPTGAQTFHGIPFLMGGGEGGDRTVIALDGSAASVTIPVGRTARRLLFAHHLGEWDSTRPERAGQEVAEYVVHYSDGHTETAPIRVRFEIAALGSTGLTRLGSAGVPSLPFLAVTDGKHTLQPRHEGTWDDMGLRQMESIQAQARWNYLWAWTNPVPEVAIESVELVPKGPPFVVSAITLGHADEHPFARQGRRPVRITLKDASDAEKSFDIDVEVDRGVATYPFALPESTAEEFLEDSFRGWGQAQNQKSSPAYAEVSAVPSATVRVMQGEEALGEVKWGDVESKGTAESSRVRFDLLDKGKNWVRVTVLDDDTGRPVPCRVHFRSPDGVPYQPHGHHNQMNSNIGTWHIDVGSDVRLGQITYASTNGTFEGWLPRGEVIVDVARGFEYDPLRTSVTIEPGQRELTLRIKRWINMNARRWYSGDSHVHFLSTQGTHTESQAEDLNVVNLLQAQWGSLYTSKEEFTGAPSISRVGDNIVYVSQENRQHFQGHMLLWGLKRPVMPWASDGPAEGEMGGTMEITLSHWADEAHAQGGYAIGPHFPMPNGEHAALIATDRLDAVEMLRQTEINHSHYYRYLNCGYRIPLVGGTDKMSNEVPVGAYRTYVYIPENEEFSYDNWCKNVARGRTFLSGGPILHFSVDGHRVGDVAQLSGPGTVEVEAWAESILPIHRLEIVQEGRVVASTEDLNGTRRLELKEKIRVDRHTWLAARCGGPNYFDSVRHHDVWNRGVFAHSSPIYVACGGEWEMFDEEIAGYIMTLIEGDLAYIAETSGQHALSNVTHHHGEEDHIAYLRRPILEARDALRRRMEGPGR